MKRKIYLFSTLVALIFSVSFAFNAYASDSCNFDISLSASEFVYNGLEQRPEVTVIDENNNAVDSELYNVTYNDAKSVNVGTYSLTVSGNGELIGSKTVKYKIKQQNIEDGAEFSLPFSSVVYTSKEFTPKLAANCNGAALIEGRDYKVSYKNNVNIGKSIIKITGINNYNGTVYKYFSIVPDTVSDLKFVKSTETSITLSWSALADANGYQIYILRNGRYVPYKLVDGKNTLQSTFSAEANNNYKFAIAAYKDVGKSRYFGKLSPAVDAYTLVSKYNKGIVIRRDDNSSTAKIMFHSVPGCSGYEVIYTPDPYFSKMKKTQTNKGYKNIAFDLTGLDTSLPIYVRIRAYLDTADGRIYGAWSDSENDFYYRSSVSAYKAENSRQLTVSYSKSTYGYGYQVVCSRFSDFSQPNIINCSGINKLKQTISGLRADASYYVKVRPYYTIGNDYYYGPYSSSTVTGIYYEYSYYASNYVKNKDRTTNLRIASEAINGTVIYPGEVFDFNEIVGPRTAERGYKKATVFTGTTGTAQELGGGICQVSSTIFNAVLSANLEIVERNQHSQKVTYVPYGRDAAISGTYKNFRWRNNTNYPIKIEMSVSGGVIRCTLYAYANHNVSPGNVDISVSKSGNVYTLRRYYNGRLNYSCTSKY